MEQLQSVVAQQHQQLEQQQVQLVALQREIQQMRQAAAAAAVPQHGEDVDGHSGLSRLMNKPSLFHGEFGHDSIHTWVLEMDALFRTFAANTPEPRKISFALGQLRDQALRWWSLREAEVQANAPNGPKACTTWHELKSAMIQAFQGRGKSANARAEMRSLRQWHFRSLPDYIRAFEDVAQRIEVPAGQTIHDELVSNFKEGLTDGQVRLALTQSQPGTLLQATQAALQAESDLRLSGMRLSRGRGLMPYRGDNGRSRTDRGRFYNGRSTSSGPWFRNGATSFSHSDQSQDRSSHGSVPMELGALASELSQAGDHQQLEEREEDELEASEHVQESGGSEEASDGEEHADRLGDYEPACANCGCNTLSMRSRRSAGPPVCWNCGQVGHVKQNCPAPVTERRSSHVESQRSSSEQRPDRGKGSSRGRRPHFR